MQEYRKVTCFYLNNNFYNMYLDNKNKRFFLRCDSNGNLSYITLEEFINIINQFSNISYVMNVEKKPNKYGKDKIKIVPKIIIGGVAVLLTSTILMTIIEMYNSQKRTNNINFNVSQSEILNDEDIMNYISYSDDKEVSNSNEELIVDTYLESEWLNYLYIYDMAYLDKALDYNNVTLNDLNNAIKNNPRISNTYKNLLYEYCASLCKKYSNIELRVLYENLKTLEVVECEKGELVKKSLSIDSYGCYIRTENKIYVLKDYEYQKGTWAYQVIFHEFSHCLRTGVWDKDGKRIKVQIEGQNFNNTITAEALNSLFAVSLFDYKENDIAYQLQSNYHKVILECMDNYDLSDYVNHSLSYYAKKLDEFNEDDNYATVILELIEMQYNDYHSTSINIEQNGYYPIYDYISKMYYQKYLNPNMTYEEEVRVTNTLLSKILFDVPQDYNIDINHFYDYLNDYCKEIGINTNNKAK